MLLILDGFQEQNLSPCSWCGELNCIGQNTSLGGVCLALKPLHGSVSLQHTLLCILPEPDGIPGLCVWGSVGSPLDSVQGTTCYPVVEAESRRAGASRGVLPV